MIASTCINQYQRRSPRLRHPGDGLQYRRFARHHDLRVNGAVNKGAARDRAEGLWAPRAGGRAVCGGAPPGD